jgi:hypothetical protein
MLAIPCVPSGAAAEASGSAGHAVAKICDESNSSPRRPLQLVTIPFFHGGLGSSA